MATRRDVIKSAGAVAAAAFIDTGVQAQTASPAKEQPVLNDPQIINLFDLERLAKDRIPHQAWEYINSGAADEITLRWNREAFDGLKLNPRVLRNHGTPDTRLSLFGQEMDFPVMIAPSAYHFNAHPQGELATARGASAAKATMVLSTLSNVSVEEVNHASERPVWFQLYVQRDRGFTKHLVERAEAAGCKALCVTVDTPTVGARNRTERSGYQFPSSNVLPNLAGMKEEPGLQIRKEAAIFQALLPETLTWKDVEQLRSLTKLPVLLKGILNADDADIAVKSGISGIYVSNHGARNLDTAPATIAALPRIADRVSGRVPILLDGGVRRGTDVLKALANGANAVLIGRPALYALSVGGAEGVTKAVNILRSEFEMAMALVGVSKLQEINRSVLWN